MELKGKLGARPYHFVHVKVSSLWRIITSLQEEALLELSHPVYRKTGSKIRNFMTFIANDLTADSEISLAGNFHYTVPTHLIGKVLVLRKNFLKPEIEFPFKCFQVRKRERDFLAIRYSSALSRPVATIAYKEQLQHRRVKYEVRI